MRKVGRARKRLLINLAAVITGVILFIVFGILISVFSEPGVPLAEKHPELELPVMILGYAGIFPFVYGLLGLVFSLLSSGMKRVFINGRMLEDIRALDSKYKSDTADGLKQEVADKLAAQGFLPVDDGGAFFRAGKGLLPDNAFCFADVNEFLGSADALLARADSVWKKVSAIKTDGRIKEVAVMFFLPLDEVSDEQIIRIIEYKERLLAESEALCDFCLYSLSEKRAYTTFTTKNIPGQPFKIERGNAAFANLCAGLNKKEFAGLFAKRQDAFSKRQNVALPARQSTNVYSETETANLAPEGAKPAGIRLNFRHGEVFYPKQNSALLYFFAIAGGILTGAFVLLLILWFAVIDMAAMQFFCIFLPVLLLPGLLLIYLAVAGHKKLELSSNGARLVRVFGNIDIFEGGLVYAEKCLMSASMALEKKRKVFVLYPVRELSQINENPSDIIFSFNNYKKYIILKYCPQNKEMLERLAAKD